MARFGISGREPGSRTCRTSVPVLRARSESPQITSLGLTYGLLTRYTSFVAVQEIVRRTTEGADDVDQPLPLPAGVSDLAVGVTSGPEPEHRVGVRDRRRVARLGEPAAHAAPALGSGRVKTKLVRAGRGGC